MLKIVAKVRQWCRSDPRRPEQDIAYQVVCACGQTFRGVRQPRFQVVRCEACGRSVFVLGRSPLPPPEALNDQVSPHSLSASVSWRRPVLAAGLTLALVIVVFVLLLTALGRRGPSIPADGVETIQDRIAAGQRALAEGHYRLAIEEFKTASDLRARQARLLSGTQARHLTQLFRQAELLANLSSESLQEILLRAASLRRPEEWQAQFAERYRGKAVVFDDHVQRVAGEHRLLTYEVRAGDETARVDLTGLKLLTTLPLDSPQRLLFGARLASITREPPGTWVIRFVPDSEVLLTDAGAAASCCPAPLEDDLRAVLRRQEQWLTNPP